MTILADHRIRQHQQQQLEQGQRGLIEPYIEKSVAHLPDGTKITSVGESSYGYDISLFGAIRRMVTREEAVELYGRHHGLVIDPCNFDQRIYKDVERYEEGEKIVLQPGEFILAVTKERFNLSNKVTAVAMEKSTLARCNITVTITPLEAGWMGFLTLEIRNNNQFPAHLTVGMGISQVLFFEGDDPCEVSYADRSGKYQDQPQEPVIPRALGGIETLKVDFKVESHQSDGVEVVVQDVLKKTLAGWDAAQESSQRPVVGDILLQEDSVLQTNLPIEDQFERGEPIRGQAVFLPTLFPMTTTLTTTDGQTLTLTPTSEEKILDEQVAMVTSDDRGNVLRGMVQPQTAVQPPDVNGIKLVPIVETVVNEFMGVIAEERKIAGWRLPDDVDLNLFFVSMSVQKLYDMLKHGDQKHRFWLQRALFAAATGTAIPDPY